MSALLCQASSRRWQYKFYFVPFQAADIDKWCCVALQTGQERSDSGSCWSRRFCLPLCLSVCCQFFFPSKQPTDQFSTIFSSFKKWKLTFKNSSRNIIADWNGPWWLPLCAGRAWGGGWGLAQGCIRQSSVHVCVRFAWGPCIATLPLPLPSSSSVCARRLCHSAPPL